MKQKIEAGNANPFIPGIRNRNQLVESINEKRERKENLDYEEQALVDEEMKENIEARGREHGPA